MRERANATRYTPDAVNVHRAGAMWEIASLAVEYQRSWSAQVLREKVQNAKPGEENSERTRLSFTEGARSAPYKYGGATTPAGVHYVHVYHVLHLFPYPKNKLSYLGTCARGGARDVHKCIALHGIRFRRITDGEVTFLHLRGRPLLQYSRNPSRLSRATRIAFRLCELH